MWEQVREMQAKEIRRIHAEEQADAERRATKPPCTDCGKPTVCKDRCRKCQGKATKAAKVAKAAAFAASPEGIEEKRREALQPTILKKDMLARGWTRKQLESFLPDYREVVTWADAETINATTRSLASRLPRTPAN
jgi:hypothetical protein